jgi:hypothetical protein
MKFDLSTLMNAADIGKRISKIARVGSSLQAEIHEIAVQTLGHIAAHGDYTLAVRLLDALPNGQRVKALAFWFNRFSGNAVTFSFDKDSGWQGKLKPKWNQETFDLDGAVKTTFADLVPEKGYNTLTMDRFRAYLRRQANNKDLNPDGSPKVDRKVQDLCAGIYAQLAKKPQENAEVVPLAALIAE